MKRRTRRVQYEPGMVVLRVLSDNRLAKIVSLLSTNTVMSNRELAKELGLSTGYANYLCRKLEKWGVLRISQYHQQSGQRSYTALLAGRFIEQPLLSNSTRFSEKA